MGDIFQSASAAEAQRIRKLYARMAGGYDRGIRFSERMFFPDGRAWVAARVHGRILEIGIGTGLNLPFYPPGVEIAGVDISPAMLEQARRRAADLGLRTDLREGDAEALPFEDASFDTVVSTLSLCTVPDERKAIAEVKRVLRPGGRFVLLEHVRSPNLVICGIEKALDPIAVRLSCDHLTREPLDALREHGFAIEELVRSRAGIIERAVAVKP
jgi:ubiquinone/menaquinone biosynthesis C-methylase UbiE